MKNLFFLAAAAMVVLIASCSKPDDVKSREDELRGGKWRQVSGTVTGYDAMLGHDTTIDYWKDVDTCYEDNTFTFGDNYTGTQFLGGLKCTAGEPDSKPFNWELAEADNHVKIFNAAESFQDEESVDAEIVALTGNTMKLRFKIITQDAPTATKDTVLIVNSYIR